MAQESGYKLIYKNVNDPNWSELTVYPPDTITGTIDSLISGETYNVAVQAVGNGSTVTDSPFSNMLTITTFLQLQAVTLTEEWSEVWYIHIGWTDPNGSGVNGYEAYYKKSAETGWTMIYTTDLYINLDSEPGVEYDYFVRTRPVDADLYLPADTPVQTLTTTTKLRSPVLEFLDVDENYRFHLLWLDQSDAPYDEIGFDIERQVNGGNWMVEDRAPTDTQEFWTAPMFPSDFCWRVVAVGNGTPLTNSDPSNVLCETAQGILPAPGLIGPWTIGNTEVTATFTYDVNSITYTDKLVGQYKKSADVDWINGPELDPADGGTITFTGLEVYVDYDFRMYARSNVSYWSDSPASNEDSWRTRPIQPTDMYYTSDIDLNIADSEDTWVDIFETIDIDNAGSHTHARVKVSFVVKTPVGTNDWDSAWWIKVYFAGQTPVKNKGLFADGIRGHHDLDPGYALAVYIEYDTDISELDYSNLKLSAEVNRYRGAGNVSRWDAYFVNVEFYTP